MKQINSLSPEAVREFHHAVWHDAKNALDLYQNLALRSAFYPGKGTPVGLMYCALKLNGEAGELAEHVGKAMRDDGFGCTAANRSRESSSGIKRWVEYEPGVAILTEDRREHLIKEVGDVLWYVAAVARELDLTLSEVAHRGLAKIADRTERGTLGGSGDDR